MKLECISNNNGELALTIGKIYELFYIDIYGNYHVENDEGIIKRVWEGRFKVIESL